MDVYLTLDYELFFGDKSGSLEQCILKPTEALLSILNKYDIKATFYVDVGYLIALLREKGKNIELAEDYRKVTEQIVLLSQNNHSIGLHIHPHWEDTYYYNGNWHFDLSRYKLSSFSEKEVFNIVTKYTQELQKHSKSKIKSYRAGGWSVQPFPPVGNALEANKIFIDSTVFSGGFYDSNYQTYDFREAPRDKSSWHFSTNPAIEDAKGKFLEVPITSIKIKPIFFWKLAFTKLLKSLSHKQIGNGTPINNTNSKLLSMLTRTTYGVVSMDGYKASLLKITAKRIQKENKKNLVVIGHPKAFTPYSLRTLDEFIKANVTKANFKTL